MNPRSRSGRNLTSTSSSTTRPHSSSLSVAARLASRPYLVHPHTPSSGFRSGTYPWKSSTTTPGWSASHPFTAFARLWIWFRSQTTVTGPNRRCNSARKATTSGPRVVELVPAPDPVTRPHRGAHPAQEAAPPGPRVVGAEEAEHPPRAPDRGDEGVPTEGRPPAPPVPGVEHRPLAPRREGAADGR